MILHNYWRSSCSWRVRIALNLKHVQYEYRTVYLFKEDGEQNEPEFKDKNPAAFVPTLEIDGQILSESLPICEFLEERYPDQGASLFPRGTDPATVHKRFLVRRLCETINSGT